MCYESEGVFLCIYGARAFPIVRYIIIIIIIIIRQDVKFIKFEKRVFNAILLCITFIYFQIFEQYFPSKFIINKNRTL